MVPLSSTPDPPRPRLAGPALRAEQLHGYKYSDRVAALLDRLHAVGTARDRAGNRTLFYDQYAALLLLDFFNAPALAGRRVRVGIVATGRRVADGPAETLTQATDRLDLSADLIAAGYRHRWQIELSFRWLKCVRGCRHLLSHDLAGVRIQVYVALIACLLLTVWTGRKPSKRTFEIVCFYLAGSATDAEVQRHLDSLPDSSWQTPSRTVLGDSPWLLAAAPPGLYTKALKKLSDPQPEVKWRR